MRTFKPGAVHQKQPANAARPDPMLSQQRFDTKFIRHLQRTIGNQGIQRLLETNQRMTTHFFSIPKIMIQGRFNPPGDANHDPLLDQYGRESGIPRDRVTQQDPGYEQWLRDRHVHITLDMPVPAIPTPDHSRDEYQLRAWEKADFTFEPQLSFRCDHVLVDGSERSFVSDIGIRLTNSTFHYFIARHIYENSVGLGVERGARHTWLTIYNRIDRHAREHFYRYEQVIDSMRLTLMQWFATLPTRNNPVTIPQGELEAYLEESFQYYVASLRAELSRTTCDWEQADYPNLLRGIPSVGGRLVPSCDPIPAVPPMPIMPTAVTSDAPR